MRGSGRPPRRPGLPPVRWVAGLAIAGGMALLGARLLERGDAAVSYRPAEQVPRRADASQFLPRVSSIVDFALHGDRLYVVDARDAAVIRFDREGEGWRETLRFGRRGEGPGEFSLPFSIAVHGDGGIAVLDGERFHRFAGDGSWETTRRLTTGCRPGRGMLAFDAAGSLHLAATCFGGLAGADTVMSVLWRLGEGGRTLSDAASGADPEVVATAARFTLDGSWGSSFVTERPLGEGAGRLLFGVGLSPCYVVLKPAGEAARACFDGTPRYRSAPPALPGSGAPAPPAGFDGPAWRWPGALPYYHDLLGTGAGDVTLRIFSPDSAVLRVVAPADGAGRDLLVVPYAGLVGCRAGGCLWRQRDEVEGMRIVLVTTEEIETLANRAAAERDS
jgi:hypothetical protein